LRPPVVDMVKLLNFTRKLQWKSGGEEYERWGGFSLYIAGPVSIENSYWSIVMWDILQEQSNIPNMDTISALNASSALIYVNKTQTASGGFGSFEGAPADIISTYYALYVLSAMLDITGGDLDEVMWNVTRTVDWILSCREGNAFKLTPESSVPGISATAAALLALDEINQLSVLSPTDQQDIRNWIIDRQVTETDAEEYLGGFTESILTNDTNLESTYHALEIISLLGGLSTIDTDSAAGFVIDCQSADGAWGNAPGTLEGSLFYAGLALRTLNLLDPVDQSYRNMIYEVNPNVPLTPLIDWRVLFIAVLIISAMVVAILALRWD